MGVSGKTTKLFTVKDKKEISKIPSEDVRSLSLYLRDVARNERGFIAYPCHCDCRALSR
jgi:hypothetical protein